MPEKKLLFITGTRADYGKIAPLLNALDRDSSFQFHIFVTGMHLLESYGETHIEVARDYSSSITLFENQKDNSQLSMDLVLAETIRGLNKCVAEYGPDLIVVHGDRAEALAGAIVGSLNNILTCHIEGGELSGTIDELIRHSITKLSHLHFVANDMARNRLLQLGEDPDSIYVIGSPDIDVMLSKTLPPIDEVRRHYDINFSEYAIFCYHPVTTETSDLKHHVAEIRSALEMSGDNYVFIAPNNDPGRDIILEGLEGLFSSERFRYFPSINHGAYLVLMKHAQYIIGNSSSGVREAPVYAVPSVNIGTRQQNRHSHSTIFETKESQQAILDAISMAKASQNLNPSFFFGDGQSAKKFIRTLRLTDPWLRPVQKEFRDLS